MAKIVITIEDKPDTDVSVKSDPSFETMMKMHKSGYEWTSAHGYALRALNEVLKVSKEQKPNKILIPKIGRR